jgi:hypothetical protein
VAGLPRFLLLGVGDLLEEIELGHLVDHGAVLQRGSHIRSSFIGRKFTPIGG